ncbi:RNA polymerase factor sigma-54 [uncultured Amaricoccus sp.]|uniref:RNA polymerase factor sigma-54 n=1 Tax=uncultured Amaricoccus sp. TaxID=339341 RepID=UPI00260FB761|nr:RNA polymerase factor sigma-54 [uncultured Amaricoccus sp.]
MALSPRIEIRQNQTLVMTPQLRQAIKLLRMSNLELADYVAGEIEKNPLLEMAPPSAAPAPGRALGVGGGDLGAFDTMAAEIGLRGHLREQVGAMRASAETREAALILIDELEDDGYLRAPAEEVRARHRLSAAEFNRGLVLVQACDPAGIGARNLRECLALQLRELDRLDPAMLALLENLSLAAAGRLVELRAICGVDAADMTDMLAELRALDPKPGLRFAVEQVQVAIPDVYVARTSAGGWAVELNTETLPRVLMNNVYKARFAGKDSAARAYISECSASASWLVRSLEQRARTILRVASEIVLHQERFFETGVGELRPLTQRAVADRLGLHESTVSRVIAGKYLSCAHGNLKLRYFFSAAIRSMEGGAEFSATAVQERIRQVIQAEAGSRALSDDKIVAILKDSGIDIARRTVAKYREGMGILSSVERRRLKTGFAKA